jgi:transposase InsO family protein
MLNLQNIQKNLTNRPRSPTQNGKVERFYYNNQRPHMGLGGKRPIDRLREFKEFENVTYV